MNKVLVVEDDQGIRQIIKHNLVRESFTVFEAEDGVEGLAVAQDNNPDLVILDVEREAEEEDEHVRELDRDRHRDVPLLRVADLVRQHRDELLGACLLDQRVEERDPLEFAKPREEGVRVGRPLRAVHRVDALVLEGHLGGVRVDGARRLCGAAADAA